MVDLAERWVPDCWAAPGALGAAQQCPLVQNDESADVARLHREIRRPGLGQVVQRLPVAHQRVLRLAPARVALDDKAASVRVQHPGVLGVGWLQPWIDDHERLLRGKAITSSNATRV